MRYLVLGAGLQGRAVLHDLARSPNVRRIVAADRDPHALAAAACRLLGTERVEQRVVDAHDEAELVAAMKGVDVVVEMLPANLRHVVARAALRAGVHLVNCHYTGEVAQLAAEAAARKLRFVTEAGLDPGLDLVLAAMAVRALDEVRELVSYGAGFPERDVAPEPPHYKITWSLEGVLRSYVRPARIRHEGTDLRIDGKDIFAPAHIHELEVAEVGTLEAYPNGDAVAYAERLGIVDTVRTTGRYVLRWPGHAAFWYPLVKLGLLGDEPLAPPQCNLSPLEALARALEPQLGYGPDERDVAIARVEVRGLKDGQPHHFMCQVVDRRDLETGLFAMNRLVGFTASIAAQLVAGGEIARAGVLSPAADIPVPRFVAELERRGVALEVQSGAAAGD